MAAAAAPTLSLVSIRFRGRADLDRLLALGLDLNETARGHHVFAVLHGAADARKLRARRLRLHDHDRRPARRRPPRAALARDARARCRAGARRYRTLVDYQADLKKIVAEHPALARAGRAAGAVRRGPDDRGRRDRRGRRARRRRPARSTSRWACTTCASGRPARSSWSSRSTSRPAMAATRASPTCCAAHAHVPVPGHQPRRARRVAGGGTATTPADDDSGATIGPSASGSGAYRRKNCAAGPGESALLPCSLKSGVDLNRNYGAFWGGPGADDQWSSQTFRGPAPFSEPEAAAVHAWSSAHQVMVLNSNHTFARRRALPAGLQRQGRAGPAARHHGPLRRPDERARQGDGRRRRLRRDVLLRALRRDRARRRTGTTSPRARSATRPRSATTTSTPTTRTASSTSTPGTLDGPKNSTNSSLHPSQGLREAMLLAGEATANPANHAIIDGTAPAGRTLRLTKDFQTTTSYVESGGSDGRRAADPRAPRDDADRAGARALQLARQPVDAPAGAAGRAHRGVDAELPRQRRRRAAGAPGERRDRPDGDGGLHLHSRVRPRHPSRRRRPPGRACASSPSSDAGAASRSPCA